MKIYDTLNFPYAEFGEINTRRIRLIVSPETTNEKRISIVHASIPSGAISEGHIHEDFDEYIIFDINGKAIVDGREYNVPAQGIIHASAGSRHECINLHPSKTLGLFCIFVPALKPYGKYYKLIEDTKMFIKESDSIQDSYSK